MTGRTIRMEVFTYDFDENIVSPTIPSLLEDYRVAWRTFQRISIINYNVRQQRLQYGSAANVSYYRYTDNSEREQYRLGLSLYLRQFPEYKTNLSAIIPEQV